MGVQLSSGLRAFSRRNSKLSTQKKGNSKAPRNRSRSEASSAESGSEVIWPWIRAMLGDEMVSRDLSDGLVLLRLLEKGCEGCVQWKGARLRPKHKFDKLQNCNLALSIARAPPFSLRLSAMGGNDVVDGRRKLVDGLLWQLMRWMAT